MDGLDQAKGKGYIYTVNDTSYRYYNYGLPPKRPAFVYPIDRYYSILRRRPDDNATRLELVKALYKVDRFEEASQQIALLQQAQYDSVEVAQLASNIDSIRTVVYQQKIEDYKAKFAADSTNKEVVLNLGQYYSKMQDYDSALAVYTTYLNSYPGDEQVLFNYAKAEANNRQFFRARDKMQTLLKMSPDNLKYQLFLAQLDVWTGQDLDTAKVYLNNVLSNEPNNLGALVAVSSLSMRQNDFTAAQGYMDKIKTINPDFPELKSLESSLTMNKFRYKEEQNYAILQQAEDLYNAGKCEDALPLYQQFLKNSPDNSLIEKEYADVNVCAGHYQSAIDIYNDLLNKGYDFNIDYSRATAYFAMGDSVQALDNFQRLAKANPDNFNVNLYLGDSYFRMHEYDKARDVYENMQDKLKLDSTQNAMVEARYNWMPVTGFRGILSSFPQYTLITPYASYYQDNLGVRNNIQGLRIDVGITSFLTVGAEGFRTSLTSNAAQVNSNTIRWDLTLRLMEALTLGVNFGNNNYGGTYTQPVADVILRSEVAHKYSAYATYSKLDASQIIYSPYLIGIRINANMYRLGGSYQWKSGLRIASDYSYYSFIEDGNQGYNFSFRIGKYFYPDFILGYEFYTGGFKRTSYLYFSPQTYTSHNLWAEWDIIHDTTATVTLGGMIGFIGNSNYILRSAYAAATFRLFDRLTLQGRITGGSSVQNYTGYSSFGATISAYWSL